MSKKYKRPIVIGIIILAVVLIMSALSNSTYALFSNDAYGANTNNFSTGMLSIEAVSKSGNITLNNALPITDEEGLDTNPYVFTIKNTGNVDYKFSVKLLSTGTSETTLSSQYIKLQIDDGAVITFSDLTNGAIKSDITLLAGESMDISIRIWLSIDTPNTELGKSFNSKIVTDGQAVYTSSNNELKHNAAQYISSLYTNADKTVVTNNGIEYNQAQSVSLMNDRLGGTTSGYNSGNIRYYGANPNNYIYFNCYDYFNQSEETCEVWRIIGVFDGKVKIIRKEIIGSLAWDQDKNENSGLTTYSNNWETSSLQLFLNGLYYDRGQTSTYTYYYGVDGSTSAVLDLTSIGIKNDDTRDFISESTWYLGDYSTTEGLYPNDIYNYERTNSVGTTIYDGNPYTINTNIGLMYASDYGYGTDLTKCSDNICNYDNWLYNNAYSWIITPYLLGFNQAFHVDKYGDVNRNYVYAGGTVRPTLYLDSEVSFNSSGDGSSSNPYQIYVKPEITPLSDFEYYLGSEYSTVDSLSADFMLPSVSLGYNDVLLTKYIGDSTEVSIPNTYTVDGVTYNVIVLSYAIHDDQSGVGGGATGVFYYNDYIESVYLSDNIKFLNCWGETWNEDWSDYWGETYENAASNLFYSCSNLKYVSQIPDSVTDMTDTFYGCTSLVTAPIIPDSVTDMYDTFKNCTNLTGTVTIKSTGVTRFTNTFSGTSKNIIVRVPAGSATYTNLNNSNMPSNVTLSTY